MGASVPLSDLRHRSPRRLGVVDVTEAKEVEFADLGSEHVNDVALAGCVQVARELGPLLIHHARDYYGFATSLKPPRAASRLVREM